MSHIIIVEWNPLSPSLGKAIVVNIQYVDITITYNSNLFTKDVKRVYFVPFFWAETFAKDVQHYSITQHYVKYTTLRGQIFHNFIIKECSWMYSWKLCYNTNLISGCTWRQTCHLLASCPVRYKINCLLIFEAFNSVLYKSLGFQQI